VFIDETWASTNMARRYGRVPRGQRLRMSVPHGHWKTTTFIAGLPAPALPAALQPRLQSHRESLRQASRPRSARPAQRTVDELWNTIGRPVDAFTPKECTNYFTACGYDAD
jgi:hypothetical protein